MSSRRPSAWIIHPEEPSPGCSARRYEAAGAASRSRQRTSPSRSIRYCPPGSVLAAMRSPAGETSHARRLWPPRGSGTFTRITASRTSHSSTCPYADTAAPPATKRIPLGGGPCRAKARHTADPESVDDTWSWVRVQDIRSAVRCTMRSHATSATTGTAPASRRRSSHGDAHDSLGPQLEGAERVPRTIFGR